MGRYETLAKKYNLLDQRLAALVPVIDPSLDAEKAKLENSLHAFVKAAWPYCGATMDYMDNWHIQVICEHLEAHYEGRAPYLVINLPPRMSKSSIVCVLFPAWIWTKNHKAQFIYASHSLEFARRDSGFCNDLVTSQWYQKRWGNKVRPTRKINNVDKFQLISGGLRQIVSVGSSVTGKNADYVIIDDPNDAQKAESIAIQYRTNNWWTQAASLRFNDLRQMRHIVLQQRVHENDLTGYLLAKEMPGLTHLFLPMEYESFRSCKTIPIKSTKKQAWEDPRTEDGELLWPSYVTPTVLEKIKEKLDSVYATAGQLQQRPSPATGGIIQKEWFEWWGSAELPPCTFILQSWDTAYSGLDPKKVSRDKITCYSACTTWGVFDDEHKVPNIILLHSWQGKVEFPDLRRKAQELASRSFDPSGKCPDMVLIEAKASGLSLLQDLRRLGIMATQFNPGPHGDKTMRVRRATHLIEAGRVWVPAAPPNFNHLRRDAHEFVETCALFPNGISNDLVDSMSQALIKLYSGGLISHPEDERPTPRYTNYREEPLYG